MTVTFPALLKAAAALALAAVLSGCAINLGRLGGSAVQLRGSGVVKTETREVGAFDRVQLDLIGKLYIDRDGKESVTLTADDNILPYIKTEVRGGTLMLRTEDNVSLMNVNDLTYRVSARNLNGLEINGAADVVVTNVDTESFDVNVNGAAKVTSSGKAAAQNLTVSGAGSYNAPSLETRRTTINHSGLGLAVVRVSDELDVRINGAGSVEYIGNPKVSKSINGVGSIRQR